MAWNFEELNDSAQRIPVIGQRGCMWIGAWMGKSRVSTKGSLLR
jgi:hypothetical protein